MHPKSFQKILSSDAFGQTEEFKVIYDRTITQEGTPLQK